MMLWSSCLYDQFFIDRVRRTKKLVGVLAVLLLLPCWGSFALAANLDYFVEIHATRSDAQSVSGVYGRPSSEKGSGKFNEREKEYLTMRLARWCTSSTVFRIILAGCR